MLQSTDIDSLGDPSAQRNAHDQLFSPQDKLTKHDGESSTILGARFGVLDKPLILKRGMLTNLPERRHFCWIGKQLALERRQEKFLDIVSARSGTVWFMDKLTEPTLDRYFDSYERIVDSLIKKIWREILSVHSISGCVITVIGKGYRWLNRKSADAVQRLIHARGSKGLFGI